MKDIPTFKRTWVNVYIIVSKKRFSTRKMEERKRVCNRTLCIYFYEGTRKVAIKFTLVMPTFRHNRYGVIDNLDSFIED